MFSQRAKTLLKNVIRHTDTHNRIVEEDDMWRQQRNSVVARVASKRRMPRAHMDRRDYDTQLPEEREDNDNSASTYWRRELQKAEEEQPGRWGHGGYKELYPEEFRAPRSRSRSSSSSSSERHSKRRKKHKSSVKKKKKKSKKKKRRKSSTNTDSDSSSKEESHSRKRERSNHHRSHHRDRSVPGGDVSPHKAKDPYVEPSTSKPATAAVTKKANTNDRPTERARPSRSFPQGNMFSRALREVRDEQSRKPAPILRERTTRSRSGERSRSARDRRRSGERSRRRRSSGRSESPPRDSQRSRGRSPSRRSDTNSRPPHRTSRSQVSPDRKIKSNLDRKWRKRRFSSNSSSSSSSRSSSSESRSSSSKSS